MLRVIERSTVGEAITHNRDNSLVYSLFDELDCPIRSDSFSIKYVVEGEETYTINGEPFRVDKEEYLLVNSAAEGKVEIESRDVVKGLCLNIQPDLIAEVAASNIQPSTPMADLDLGMFFCFAHYPENKYHARTTALGNLIRLAANRIAADPHAAHGFNEELFYSLAENLVKDQTEHFVAFQSIPAISYHTRKYLLRCIWRGRDFMDAHFLEPLHIRDVAREACMSEYHFFRMFRRAMGVSPHQYLLAKRLEMARQLLANKQMSVSEVAYESGFADVQSFSKAFRKKYQVTPGSLI